MKDRKYITHMLRRAEVKKRKALREGEERILYQQSAIIRILKIVLELPKNTGRQRLKKDRQDMDRLLRG